jgi:hypothetical protein
MKGAFMKLTSSASMLFFLAITLATFHVVGTEALAQSSYYTSRGCATCHSAPVVATCNGCHYHGNRSLRAATNKTSYAPGETVTVTLTSGSTRSGWIKAILYDQSNSQIAASNGSASGMGGATTFPASLTAPAPTTPGTYTWKMAYYGNSANTGGTHGEVAVSTNSFTVSAPSDTTAPVVSAFSLPTTATTLSVPVTSFTATDNVGVTGYMITKTATAPAASAAGWSASAPSSVTAVAGGNIFYAWAKDAAGNVSLSRSAGVTVTTSSADTTKPVLTISALADGTYTNNATINISGYATDAGGVQSVTLNGQAIIFYLDGSFSAALPLAAGANTITVVATDNAGNQEINTRTITYDPTAPILSVSTPADNSSSAQSFITVAGTINETSTVQVTDNGGNQQSASISGNSFTATVYLESGVNTITIAATDLAGNTSSAKRTVTYDSVTMTLAVTNPNQDMTTSQSSIVLTGTLVDAIAPVSLTITMNGRTYTPQVTNGSFTQNLSFSQAGTYAIVVTATDGAGNRSSVSRNVIYTPTTTPTTSHPFGWTDPKRSHDDYVEKNGVSSCTSCHSIDLASKGQPMSCYNCHGKEWRTPSTTPTTSHPFGWTDPKRSHDDYVEKNGVSSCTSCHSTNRESKGKPMSCYNCHGKEW